MQRPHPLLSARREAPRSRPFQVSARHCRLTTHPGADIQLVSLMRFLSWKWMPFLRRPRPPVRISGLARGQIPVAAKESVRRPFPNGLLD